MKKLTGTLLSTMAAVGVTANLEAADLNFTSVLEQYRLVARATTNDVTTTQLSRLLDTAKFSPQAAPIREIASSFHAASLKQPNGPLQVTAAPGQGSLTFTCMNTNQQPVYAFVAVKEHITDKVALPAKFEVSPVADGCPSISASQWVSVDPGKSFSFTMNTSSNNTGFAEFVSSPVQGYNSRRLANGIDSRNYARPPIGLDDGTDGPHLNSLSP